MKEMVLVSWRDIPAQVLVRSGRNVVAKKKLSDRFEEAIDRCAMKVGAKDSSSYLDEWKKVVIYKINDEDDPEEAVNQESSKIENEFSKDKIMELINSGGFNQ